MRAQISLASVDGALNTTTTETCVRPRSSATELPHVGEFPTCTWRAVPCRVHGTLTRHVWELLKENPFEKYGFFFFWKNRFFKNSIISKTLQPNQKILLRGYGLTKIRQKTSKIVQKYDEKCSFWLQIFVSHVEIFILLNVYVPCRAVYVYTSHVDTFRGNSGWIQSSNWSFCLKTRCSADPLALRTFSQAAGAATSGAAVSHWPNLPTCLSWPVFVDL